ncbi:MAG: antA/AntB antirepressor family protein [Desulfarculus sp.]|nr:antA/AntB antirepressor family protein [Desulfarculus sp.]
MNELVKIQQSTVLPGQEQVVDARELREKLESSTRFNDWIKYRLRCLQFQRGRDFEVLLSLQQNPQGGRPRKEYLLSLAMAKHLCMMEQTHKGHQVREYFIWAENELHRVQTQALHGNKCDMIVVDDISTPPKQLPAPPAHDAMLGRVMVCLIQALKENTAVRERELARHRGY